MEGIFDIILVIRYKIFFKFLEMRHSLPKQKIKYFLLSILLSGVIIPGWSMTYQEEDSILQKHINFSAEDIIRGERLFYGLVYLENKSIDCASCHNTRESDTLNWNPNALEISLKYKDKTASDLSSVLLKPAGTKMGQVHKDFQLTPEDIVLIKAYMDEFTEIGLKKSKPVITNLLLFIIASILLLLSATDLIIKKIFKKPYINAAILLFTTIYIIYIIAENAIAMGRSKDYAPDQPVKFSHKVHAGQNKTDCIYCHSAAPYSKSAGIPPVNVCMNCHLIVRNGTRSGSGEIAKVIKAFEEKKPIEWVKIYNLPDHVFFSHAQHVSAGQVACQKCHGKVEENDVIRQVTDLSMGWCVNCHRTTKVNFEGNLFYTHYRDLTEKMKRGEIDSVTVDMIGGIECMKCHY